MNVGIFVLLRSEELNNLSKKVLMGIEPGTQGLS